MKSFLRILFFLLILSATCSFSQTRRQLKKGYLSKFGPEAYVGYLAYVPTDYAANPTKKFPLLIFLHGAGEKSYQATDSSELNRVKTHGPPKLIEGGMNFPFIVISPQCPFEDWENVTTDNYKTSVLRPGEFVDEILETIKQLYRVDVDRVYITGLSMGGSATWTYMMQYPEKVAAAIPISGWIDNPSNGCNIAKENIPVWAFQNKDDPKTLGTPGFINYINACEPAPTTLAKMTTYPGTNHEGWTVTYNNTGVGIKPDNIYDWLMRQYKNKVITSTQNTVASESVNFKVYPIPAKNLITINYSSTVSDVVHIQIYNQVSNLVIEKSQNVIQGNNILEVDLSEIQNGHYVLSLSGSTQMHKKTIIVSK